jgi:pyruvate/2-oxoglutarate dehydrogenase complex dihydrolipoamide dehydrogenase (E3) component
MDTGRVPLTIYTDPEIAQLGRQNSSQAEGTDIK